MLCDLYISFLSFILKCDCYITGDRNICSISQGYIGTIIPILVICNIICNSCNVIIVRCFFHRHLGAVWNLLKFLFMFISLAFLLEAISISDQLEYCSITIYVWSKCKRLILVAFSCFFNNSDRIYSFPYSVQILFRIQFICSNLGDTVICLLILNYSICFSVFIDLEPRFSRISGFSPSEELIAFIRSIPIQDAFNRQYILSFINADIVISCFILRLVVRRYTRNRIIILIMRISIKMDKGRCFLIGILILGHDLDRIFITGMFFRMIRFLFSACIVQKHCKLIARIYFYIRIHVLCTIPFLHYPAVEYLICRCLCSALSHGRSFIEVGCSVCRRITAFTGVINNVDAVCTDNFLTPFCIYIQFFSDPRSVYISISCCSFAVYVHRICHILSLVITSGDSSLVQYISFRIRLRTSFVQEPANHFIILP